MLKSLPDFALRADSSRRAPRSWEAQVQSRSLKTAQLPSRPSMFGGRLGIVSQAKHHLAASGHSLPTRKPRQSSGKTKQHAANLNMNTATA